MSTIRPFTLQQSRLEILVEGLLYDFNGKAVVEQSLPIPVEDIIEFHLGYRLKFDNLYQRWGCQNTLGFIRFEKKEIWIDSSLEKGGGRLLFTLGHEVGHDQLHNPKNSTLILPGSKEWQQKNGIFCTNGSIKEPWEQDADRYSSTLLMPELLLRKSFKELLRDFAYELTPENMDSIIIPELCKQFGTSKQAMEIRVEKLRLFRDRQSGFNRGKRSA